MRILLLGAPGSGKGTQGGRLGERLGLKHIVTGDLLRAVAASTAPIGREIAQIMARGDLVPDDFIDRIAIEAVRAEYRGFVLDGYPRTARQAVALDEELRRFAAPVNAAVVFRLPADQLVERLLARGRPDDTADIIRHRLNLYLEKENGILSHYPRAVVELDAQGTVDEVELRLLEALREVADVA